MSDSTTIRGVIESIRQHQRERDHLMDTLLMWEEVKDRGIDPETVDRFGYHPSDLSPKIKSEILKARAKGLPDPILGVRRPGFISTDPYRGDQLANGNYECVVYSYVILKDGARRVLDPPVKVPRKP